MDESAAGEVGLEDEAGAADGDVLLLVVGNVVLLVSVMMLTLPSSVTLAACVRMAGNS